MRRSSTPPQLTCQPPSLMTGDRLGAEKSLPLLIKRFVSEFSSNEDSVSSRCSKSLRETLQRAEIRVLQKLRWAPERPGSVPSCAHPSKAVISSALGDSQPRIKDSRWTCLEVFVDYRGLSSALDHRGPIPLQATQAASDSSQNCRQHAAVQWSVILSCQ